MKTKVELLELTTVKRLCLTAMTVQPMVYRISVVMSIKYDVTILFLRLAYDQEKIITNRVDATIYLDSADSIQEGYWFITNRLK